MLSNKDSYKLKYFKYKKKYLDLKKATSEKVLTGGALENKPKLVLFKAEWCGHCRNFKPTWEAMKNSLTNIDFKTYDADNDESVMSKYGIQGFPTIVLEKNDKVIEYNGERSVDNIIQFVNENLN
jgi:protein disulfide-isomerase-like protein